jgi:UDP-N-acetylmuramoyl-L-alanyl-D-glutamate--2,6-diaminopimelate ligase
LRPLVAGRLIVVFGAGGDRDPGKRPLMGDVAERFADLAIVTSDNPRTEDAEAIVDEILAGMSHGEYRRVVDRRAAIGAALSEAGADDLVLLAGKGHETYQIVGAERHPFDELEIVRELQGGQSSEVRA